MNCSVTKLNAVVNNDNLPVRNTVVLRMSDAEKAASAAASKRYFIVSKHMDASAVIELENVGGTFCDASGNPDGTTVTINKTGDKKIYVSVNTQKVLIKNKDAIRMLKTYESGDFLGCLTVNLEDVEYCSNITQFFVGGNTQTGDISELPNNGVLVVVVFNTTNIVADISLLAKYTSIIDITVTNSLGITGDFASWAPYRSAGNLGVKCSANQVKCNGVYLSAGTHTLAFDGAGGVSVTS